MKKRAKIITTVILAVLMLACLGPLSGFATPEKSFSIKNDNSSGDDHGYILAAYNGSAVTIEKNETRTFTYIPDVNSVRISFEADPDYQIEYCIIGNGTGHLGASPSNIDVREYTGGCGSNDTIKLDPKWTALAAYTIDTAVSSGGTITPDQTVSRGSDCTIRYNADTGYHLESVTVDGADATYSNPDSYTFTDVTSDHSISVVYEADVYDIIYNLNGGTLSVPNPTAYTVETPAFTLNNPEEYGCEFIGWTGDGLSGNTLMVTVPTDLGGDREYTANWKSDFTVTFGEGAHGSAAGTKTFTGLHYGDSFPDAPEIIPETGWAFDGWPALPATVTGDASYTAAYTQLDYYVTFDIGSNGTTSEPTSLSGLHYGDTFPAAPGVTPEPGWTFDYWTPTLPQIVGGSETYSAHYTQLKYTVTWNNWDGALLERDMNTDYGVMPSYGGAAPVKPSTAQYCYMFSGWTPAIDVVTDDVIYTALFSPEPRSYTVTFKDYDGTVLGSDIVEYGCGAAAPAVPHNRAGYHFTGWDTDFSNITGDVTITAQYAVNTYKVRFFKADGKTQIGRTQTVNWGSAARAETAPIITGTTFDGWKLSGDDPRAAASLGSVKMNIDATAKYKAVLYTVTFVDFNGSELKCDNVPYGGAANPPASPSREGYTFTGWSLEYDNVTGDLRVFAQYTVNKYTVTFVDNNGSVIDKQAVEWNTGAAAPDDPARDGYMFTGWDVPFNNIKTDTVVNAKYVAITAPSPVTAAEISQEPIPKTGDRPDWLWCLLLIPLAGMLLIIAAVRRSVIPVAETLVENKNGTYTIKWGYNNRKNRKYRVGEDKSVFTVITGKLIKSSANPPVEFKSGKAEDVFTTVVDKDTEVQWKINNRRVKVDLKKLE